MSPQVRESLPEFLSPMLLRPGRLEALPQGQWAVEVKFDGIRAQLHVDRGQRWRLYSRPGRECAAEFPELQDVAAALSAHRVVLDGELVLFGPDGRPDFS